MLAGTGVLAQGCCEPGLCRPCPPLGSPRRELHRCGGGGGCRSPCVTGGLWVVFNSSVPRQPSRAACWAQRCCFPNPSPRPCGCHLLGTKVRVGSWLGEQRGALGCAARAGCQERAHRRAQCWSPPRRGEGRLSRASVSPWLVGALANRPKPSRGCNPLEKNI